MYSLTPKGIDLAPVLLEMIVWGARYEKTAAPPSAIREMTSERDQCIGSIKNKEHSNKLTHFIITGFSSVLEQ